MKTNLKIRNVIFILIGSAIFSFGIVNINIENHLAEGGFTGITLLLYFLFSLDPSYTNLILNIPLFFVGWKLLGRTTFLYTLIGTFSVSFFLWIFQRYELFKLHVNLQNDMTLAHFLQVHLLVLVLELSLSMAERLAALILLRGSLINISVGVWEKRCLCLMQW